MKKVLLLLVAVLALFSCLRINSDAAGNGATTEEQNYVARLVNDDPVYGERLREKKETLLTETIAPLFRFDPIEYAQSGVFSLSKIEGYYWVDVVTETGAFAGIATVIIKDGSLKSVFFARSSETAGPDYLGRHSMPCCFENYRQDIERVIGKEITADPVLIVKVNNNRDAYYIDQPEGEYDYFVLHPLDGEKITQDSMMIFMIGASRKRMSIKPNRSRGALSVKSGKRIIREPLSLLITGDPAQRQKRNPERITFLL